MSHRGQSNGSCRLNLIRTTLLKRRLRKRSDCESKEKALTRKSFRYELLSSIPAYLRANVGAGIQAAKMNFMGSTSGTLMNI